MATEIVEIAEDTELIGWLRRWHANHRGASAWCRFIGTVQNVVFYSQDGGDMVCPGVLQLVGAEGVIKRNGSKVEPFIMATVTKDGKSVVAGRLKTARVLAVSGCLQIGGDEEAVAADANAQAAASEVEEEPQDVTDPRESRFEAVPSALTDADDEQQELEMTSSRPAPATRTQEAKTAWSAVADESEQVARKSEKRAGEVIPNEADDGGSNPWAAVAEVSDTVSSSRKKQGTTKTDNRRVVRAEPASVKEDVSAAAAKLKAFAEEFEDHVDVDELAQGDILHHPVLGKCKVLRVVSDDAAQVQVGRGRSKKLMLRIFDIIRESDGVYRLQKKK